MKEQPSYEELETKVRHLEQQMSLNKIPQPHLSEDTSQPHVILDDKLESIGLVSRRIAHDFNNVLGGILGYASFIKSLIEEDNSIYKYIDTIESSASKGADMTKRLLDFGRGEKPKSFPINLTKLLKETVRTLREENPENISIQTSFGDDMPDISGDEQQFQQALFNIAHNAIEAMPGGGELVFNSRNTASDDKISERFPETTASPYICISITDTGCGIDPEIAERIFEPLFTTKDKTKNPGFGLSTTYRVVKNHGGFIDFTTAVGQGTTFDIFLPGA